MLGSREIWSETQFGRQYEALRTQAAWCAYPSDWLRISGADRTRFTNGLVTCDLKDLRAGRGAYGFFTDPKGKILADVVFHAAEDELRVELPAGSGVAIAEHMRKYVVADQVDVSFEESWSSIRLVGPDARSRLGSVLDVPIDASGWDGLTVESGDDLLLVRGERRIGVPAIVLAGPASAVTAVSNSLETSGMASASAEVVSRVRIEEGIGWFGSEFGAGEAFPQESGLEDWAVSYEKGCYLGQEVVARIHFRGKVNRSLRGVEFSSGAEPERGTSLSWSGDAVGAVGEVVFSPALGCAIGLALVHKKVPDGAALETSAGQGVVVPLPFDLSARGN